LQAVSLLGLACKIRQKVRTGKSPILNSHIFASLVAVEHLDEYLTRMRICVKEGLNQFKVSAILIDLSKYAIQGIAIENYVERRRLIDAKLSRITNAYYR